MQEGGTQQELASSSCETLTCEQEATTRSPSSSENHSPCRQGTHQRRLCLRQTLQQFPPRRLLHLWLLSGNATWRLRVAVLRALLCCSRISVLCFRVWRGSFSQAGRSSSTMPWLGFRRQLPCTRALTPSIWRSWLGKGRTITILTSINNQTGERT